jgi:ankyrin repeat protein
MPEGGSIKPAEAENVVSTKSLIEKSVASVISPASRTAIGSPESNSPGTKPPTTPKTASTQVVREDCLLNLHGGTHAEEDIANELNFRPERLDERDSNFRTPLLAACFAKNWALAKYFAERGADVSAKDRFGATALIFSAMCGQFDMCLLLASKGADVYLKNNV